MPSIISPARSWGRPGGPCKCSRSDDLRTWTLLQQINAPEIDPTFIDLTKPLPLGRFYRAVAP